MTPEKLPGKYSKMPQGVWDRRQGPGDVPVVGKGELLQNLGGVLRGVLHGGHTGRLLAAVVLHDSIV